MNSASLPPMNIRSFSIDRDGDKWRMSVRWLPLGETGSWRKSVVDFDSGDGVIEALSRLSSLKLVGELDDGYMNKYARSTL